jgi:23S rRNA (cytosine1962-C5)-methyltransferase
MSGLGALLERASQARRSLAERLRAEGTDCWRLFHGVAEGRPGLTVDLYGPLLLVQTFREPLTAAELEEIAAWAGRTPVYRHRGAGEPPPLPPVPLAREPVLCHEQGQAFRVVGLHRGQDPWLFLDFRAGRRWLRQTPPGASVLNLFAYTCTAGVAAAARGAEVWNVDFGRRCLEVGEENARLNGLPPERFRLLRQDVFPVLRQLAGLGVKGRAARRSYLRLEPRQFDCVVLDPPTTAVSPFGRVDLVNDYESMLKPCLLATRPGGWVLATNHAPGVTLDQWLGRVQRCAQKCGRPLEQVQVLEPEEDFPSFDGAPPLKMALLQVGSR